jgi:hypothetical protein
MNQSRKMSNYYIAIIPEQPDFVPEQTKIKRAIEYFRSIAPGIFDSEIEIETNISKTIRFIDCGSNFECVTCPSCGSNIDIELWQIWMKMDYQVETFSLNY